MRYVEKHRMISRAERLTFGTNLIPHGKRNGDLVGNGCYIQGVWSRAATHLVDPFTCFSGMVDDETIKEVWNDDNDPIAGL